MFFPFWEQMEPFFKWMQSSWLNQIILNSWWAGAAINIGHLLSLVFFAGGLLVVNFRLLGVGTTALPIVAADARPWMLGGLTGLAATGILQLVSLAERNYYNWNFWFKMSVLIFALIYTFTIWRKVVSAPDTMSEPLKAKLVGLISMGLWMAVVIPGRLIGLT
jgi:hypothetical protein